MNEQKKLMEAVYVCGFAADEARLFLDTHPQDRQALEYYRKKTEQYRQAVARYEEKYGPIMQTNGAASGHWQWATSPWPWEGGR